MPEELATSVIKAILERRSVRRFRPERPKREDILKILEAGIWAPSGHNNQPWRFVLIWSQEMKEKLAKLTIYGGIVKGAPLLIGVFLAKKDMYHQIKDHQSAGACIQNMMLSAHSLGLGTCWLGEIVNREREVKEVLGLPQEEYELCAFLAVGYPDDKSKRTGRRPLSSFILKEIE